MKTSPRQLVFHPSLIPSVTVVMPLLFSLPLLALVFLFCIANVLFSYSATQPQVWNKTQCSSVQRSFWPCSQTARRRSSPHKALNCHINLSLGRPPNSDGATEQWSTGYQYLQCFIATGRYVMVMSEKLVPHLSICATEMLAPAQSGPPPTSATNRKFDALSDTVQRHTCTFTL